jgi:DNA-binding NarL/FixJ family response regulator
VIVLTTAEDEAAARAAFAGSGLGYIVKAVADATSADPSPFVARQGERRRALAAPSGEYCTASTGDHGLTSREVEVMRALATGASTVEVARELYVSPKTAKNHIAHIYAKLGVSSRTQAVAKALRLGIVRID